MVSIGNFAYSVCQEFKETTSQIEKDRNEIWGKKPFLQKVPYHLSTIVAVTALLATTIFAAFAAINFSSGLLFAAAVSAGVMVIAAYVRERFNNFTDAEELCRVRFSNPLGIDKNKDKLPEASSLKGHRQYFEVLVAPPHNEKAKRDQDNGLKPVYTLFDKKIDQQDLKEKISTLVVTSLLLESIQHVYEKREEEGKKTAHLADKLIDQTNFPSKDRIRKLADQLKAPTKEFKEKVAITISGEDNKTRFRMNDLDDLIKD